MASFEKRVGPNGPRWRVRVRVKGHPIHTRTFDRKTDARDWAAKIETDLRRGKQVPTRIELTRTVGDSIDRYLTDVLPNKPRNKDQRHLTTRLNWWSEAIGKLPIVELTPAVISDQKARLFAEKNRYGNTLSPATVNRYLAAFSTVLKTAKNEWHWIERNPMENVSKGPESKGRDRFLSVTERKRLLDQCKNSRSEHLYPVVVLALSTGMRKGEILELTWNCIDLKRGKIRIKDPKNGEQRTVGLSGHALELLMDMSNVRRIDSARVFPGKKDQAADIEAGWQCARDRAGLENFRFHDLRHTAAAELLMSGATLGELAQILGHKTLAMVRRYSHLTDDHAVSIVARMNHRVFADG